MDVNSIASLGTAMANERTGDAIGVSVLKKALDIQSSVALSLLDAIPQQPASNPPNLGNSIDVRA